MDPVSAAALVKAVGVALDAAIGIHSIIKALRTFPIIIADTHDEMDQMILRLKHLQRESQTRTLPLDMLEAWLRYQQTCNRTLDSIQEILSSYAKRSKSFRAPLNFLDFQFFSGKDKLVELLKPLKECSDYFSWLSKNILKAPLTSDILCIGVHGSTGAASVVSLGQYFRMEMKDEIAKREGSS
ncbi:hypothetical protein ONS95_014273 [Cadophora gregata]|uniref:uncharacterized protein n=1 Tax=Cadophora gregata TaxID=51156 RepID=UPI0026DD60ED|nr:uncharacterized protein ONS95_014273 [Cadophora gregata]KAK0114032.1 hypothetical protein ONS96_014878 [Cadophora gregata f. sp. sojae]KAK0114792.1 hypothetical protein ONS95_014273 [Cadophora gregata]